MSKLMEKLMKRYGGFLLAMLLVLGLAAAPMSAAASAGAAEAPSWGAALWSAVLEELHGLWSGVAGPALERHTGAVAASGGLAPPPVTPAGDPPGGSADAERGGAIDPNG